MHRQNNQRGAALITALIFLIIITMLSLSSMRSSMMELKQAGNDEIRSAAFQNAQTLVDAVLDTPSAMAVVGGVGFRSCSADIAGASCNTTTMTLPDSLYAAELADQSITIIVERLGPTFRPPPRGLGTSARMLTAAAFQIDARFMRGDQGEGHSEITQGMLVVVPKGQ